MEGPYRYDNAMKGIEALRSCVDSLLIINNENIKNLYKNEPAMTAFSKSNEILSSAAKGISEIITVQSSYVRVDFADVSNVMRDSGRAHISVARAAGEGRAEQVAEQSFNSPLLDHQNISGAHNIFLHLAVEDEASLTYAEVERVLEYVQASARNIAADGTIHAANIIWGMSVKPGLGDNLELVLVATGFDEIDGEVDFVEYDRVRLLTNSDPSLPSEGHNIGSVKRMRSYPTPKNGGEMNDDDIVILPMRKRRYPNAEIFLRSPSYIKRSASLINEEGYTEPQHPSNASSTEDGVIDGELFNN